MNIGIFSTNAVDATKPPSASEPVSPMYIKVVKKRSLGLRAYQKLLLQLIVTGCFCWYLHAGGTGTAVYIPFFSSSILRDAFTRTVSPFCSRGSPFSKNSACSAKSAVLGFMGELGEFAPAMHREVGEYAAKCGVDLLFCIGAPTRPLPPKAHSAPYARPAWGPSQQSVPSAYG